MSLFSGNLFEGLSAALARGTEFFVGTQAPGALPQEPLPQAPLPQAPLPPQELPVNNDDRHIFTPLKEMQDKARRAQQAKIRAEQGKATKSHSRHQHNSKVNQPRSRGCNHR